ncbi:MAG: hypothetical protein AB7F96_16025 [Beijerinckiaceae bacterium]
MFRFIIRTIGIILLAGGFAALIVDGTRSIAVSKVTVTTFGQTAAAVFPKAFPLLKPAVEQNIHPLLWDPFLRALFLLPAFLVVAVLGLLLIWLARRRRLAVGYSGRE